MASVDIVAILVLVFDFVDVVEPELEGVRLGVGEFDAVAFNDKVVVGVGVKVALSV